MDLWQKLEIVGTVIGLVYLWLEYKANVWLWLAGIVMPAVYIYVYYKSGFYADMGINIYYLVAGLYGWALWLGKGLRHKRNDDRSGGEKTLPISRTPRRMWPGILIAGALFFVAIAYILINFTDSSVPYGDSFTTAFSIVGLWMLSRKYAEQWLVWLAVDVMCCALYLYKGLYPTAALYGLYSVIAVFGYFEWLRMIKVQNGRADNTPDPDAIGTRRP